MWPNNPIFWKRHGLDAESLWSRSLSTFEPVVATANMPDSVKARIPRIRRKKPSAKGMLNDHHTTFGYLDGLRRPTLDPLPDHLLVVGLKMAGSDVTSQ